MLLNETDYKDKKFTLKFHRVIHNNQLTKY